MLTPTAQADLEAEVDVRGCTAAARRFFGGPEFDRPAAINARVVQVDISRRTAQIVDTDPNDPAIYWTTHGRQWKLASFIPIG
jgi:post-segregation antitoxin (ccd killing protein)